MACQVDLGAPPDAGACLASPDVFALGLAAPDGGALPAVWDSYLVAEQCNTRRCHDFQDGHGTLRFRPPEQPPPAAGTALDGWPQNWRENYLSAIQFLACGDPLQSRLLTMPEGAGYLHPPGPVVRDRAAAATEISGWIAAPR